MRLQPTFRRLVFVVVFIVTLAFGWWPFNFAARNDVDWDASAAALRFNSRYEAGDWASRGLAVSKDILDTRGWSGLSILIELRGRPRAGGLGVFLELFESDTERLPMLLVAQWQDHLAIRSRRDKADVSRGYSEIGFRDAFASGEFFQMLLTTSPGRTSLYVNGELAETRSGYRLVGPDNTFVGKLIFGNSADGTNPFTGEIRQVAIYDRALKPVALSAGHVQPAVEYRFEHFEPIIAGETPVAIPLKPAVMKKTFLGPIRSDVWELDHYRRDIIVNALGFIPIGLCFVAIARRRIESPFFVLILVAAGSFALSLTIELGQGYLPHRDSSQLDLLLNTISGTVAAFVPRRWLLLL